MWISPAGAQRESVEAPAGCSGIWPGCLGTEFGFEIRRNYAEWKPCEGKQLSGRSQVRNKNLVSRLWQTRHNPSQYMSNCGGLWQSRHNHWQNLNCDRIFCHNFRKFGHNFCSTPVPLSDRHKCLYSVTISVTNCDGHLSRHKFPSEFGFCFVVEVLMLSIFALIN